MKLCYLLQELEDVPFGYHFTLYSYGPFDSDLLTDLTAAEASGVITSKIVHYPNGYGYEITPTKKSGSVIQKAQDSLGQYNDRIDSLVQKFGGMSKNELEVLSTAVYVDRESASQSEELSVSELVQRVHEIKRNFSETFVEDKVSFLMDEGLLLAVQ
jgi:hypothetical protein